MSGKIIFFTAIVVFFIVVGGDAVLYYEDKHKLTIVSTPIPTLGFYSGGQSLIYGKGFVCPPGDSCN